jgi:hypothetical protein
MLGVAAVSNFILDNYRSPFNIGQDIRLSGFTIKDARKLAEGLQEKVIEPQRVLEEVIEWTGGQPFLTQKICHLISTSHTGFGKESPVNPIYIGDFIQSQVISNWVSQDSPEHLNTIRNRLLNKRVTGRRMLKLYQEILRNGEITDDGSPDQIELRLTGLVVQDRQKLKVYNKIYRNVFNETWVTTELNKIPAYYERVDQLAEILLRTEFDENQRAALIEEIPAWTGGNLELTIIVILLLIDNKNELREGQEKPKIEQLIQKNIVENWLQNKAADHLQKIQNSLLTPDKNVRSTLEIYQEILQGRVFADNKPEKLALQQAELVIKNDDYLEVTNRIYQEVFNVQWVKQELEKLVKEEDSTFSSVLLVLGTVIILSLLSLLPQRTPDKEPSPSIPEICTKRDFNISLEKNIQQLQDLQQQQGDQFYYKCGTQLNELRLIQQAIGLAVDNFVADVPGREGAFEILCKIPPSSDNFKEAQFWAKRWYNDRAWKSDIDRALQDNLDCQKLIE